MRTGLDPQERGPIARRGAARGMGWGVLGGFAGTAVMDMVLICVLSAVGLPAFTCFAIVGDTVGSFFALLGADFMGGILLGVATHYVVGPIIGALYGAAVARVRALQAPSLIKSTVQAVLYIEILSQPMLATTPILLKMTASDAIMWYGGAFLMHLMAGSVLGLVIHLGLGSASGVGKTSPIKSVSTS